MSDSDWRDPFADDEAARERAARRAEREQRRREEDARESLGERVKEGLANPPPPPAPEPASEPTPTPEAVPGPASAPESAPAPEPEPMAEPEPSAEPAPEPAPAAHSDPPPPDLPPPPPPARPPSGGAVHRRRIGALVGLILLIAAVAAAGAFISQPDGDDEPAPETGGGKPKKTTELVVPEGFDRSQVATVVKKAGLEGSYEKATQSSKAIDLKKVGADGAGNLEGFLFPATYEIFKGARVDSLVEKQLEAFEANLAEVDLKTAKAAGYDVYDVVIIASMIEREIAVPEERQLAASVIYNRLDAGNPLGIDATIRFEDQNYTEPLVQSRLEADTPYNTRVNPGLPPGPIGNPGLASLQAAANPADTDFFYYVIKPGTCNEHAFVETEAEFADASAEYQAALQAEGGSPTEC